MAIANATNKFGVAKWIVDPTAGQGTHTTIASALTDASSGDTIFIRPGTYTENLTLKAGVDLTAFSGDEQTPVVTIVGKATMTTAGTVTISNIKLQTNSDFFLAVTGSAASIVYLKYCNLVCSNNTGISFTSSSSSALIQLEKCNTDITTTGISLFAHSSSGVMNIYYCFCSNTGSSTTASTASAGQLWMLFSKIKFTITTSSTAIFVSEYCDHDLAFIDTVCITHGGSGASRVCFALAQSGTASAISISSSLFVEQTIVNSSNTNAITGAGTIVYAHLEFPGSSATMNVTTQTRIATGPSKLVGGATSGGTNTFTVTNDSNTASSSANIISNVGGGTAADPTYQAIVNGVTTWTWGIDNSDSDAWVLSQGTALGTNNVMKATTAGEVTKPLQPAFLAYNSTNRANQTGAGAVATVTFDTEVFDVNADFASNTFTAPVTGKYLLCSNVTVGDFTTANSIFFAIVTSNRSYASGFCSPVAVRSVAGFMNLFQSSIVDMDAADTATVTVSATGEAGNTNDIFGQASPTTYFSGSLIC